MFAPCWSQNPVHITGSPITGKSFIALHENNTFNAYNAIVTEIQNSQSLGCTNTSHINNVVSS